MRVVTAGKRERNVRGTDARAASLLRFLFPRHEMAPAERRAAFIPALTARFYRELSPELREIRRCQGPWNAALRALHALIALPL